MERGVKYSLVVDGRCQEFCLKELQAGIPHLRKFLKSTSPVGFIIKITINDHICGNISITIQP